jgi:hypothetical protein
MPKKPESAELTERVIIPLSPELLARIEDYRFENRVTSRAEAMRQLLASALDAACRPSIGSRAASKAKAA